MIDENLSIEENKKIQELNPLLDWARKMIFPAGLTIEIKRKPEWGGDVIYNNFNVLEQDYLTGKLHPGDLKKGISETLINWFEPIRNYTKENHEALDFVKSIK